MYASAEALRDNFCKIFFRFPRCRRFDRHSRGASRGVFEHDRFSGEERFRTPYCGEDPSSTLFRARNNPRQSRGFRTPGFRQSGGAFIGIPGANTSYMFLYRTSSRCVALFVDLWISQTPSPRTSAIKRTKVAELTLVDVIDRRPTKNTPQLWLDFSSLNRLCLPIRSL
jgi:hypothetical protein